MLLIKWQQLLVNNGLQKYLVLVEKLGSHDDRVGVVSPEPPDEVGVCSIVGRRWQGGHMSGQLRSHLDNHS